MSVGNAGRGESSGSPGGAQVGGRGRGRWARYATVSTVAAVLTLPAHLLLAVPSARADGIDGMLDQVFDSAAPVSAVPDWAGAVESLNPVELPSMAGAGVVSDPLSAWMEQLAATVVSDVQGIFNTWIANPLGGLIDTWVNAVHIPDQVVLDDSGESANPADAAGGDPGWLFGAAGSTGNPDWAVIATVEVGGQPWDVTVSTAGPAAGDVYVTNAADDTVSVIDPASNTVIATIAVGERPWNVGVVPTGPQAGDVYVSNSGDGTVSVIDPVSNTVIDTITVGGSPWDIAIIPTGPAAGDVYVTDSTADTLSVIDPATHAVTDSVMIGGQPWDLAVSPTGPAAGDVYIVDYSNGTVLVIDPVTHAVTDAIDAGNPWDLTVSPAGPAAGDIYVTDNFDNVVLVIDPATNTVAGAIPVGVSPWDVAVNPTGDGAGAVYVANAGDNTVSVIDPATNTVTATITVGAGPQNLAVSSIDPYAGNIYVGNTADGTVSVIAAPGSYFGQLSGDDDAGTAHAWNALTPQSYGNDPGRYLSDGVLTVAGLLQLTTPLSGMGSVDFGAAGPFMTVFSATQTGQEFASHWDGMLNGNIVDYLHTIIEGPELLTEIVAPFAGGYKFPLEIAGGMLGAVDSGITVMEKTAHSVVDVGKSLLDAGKSFLKSIF